ncbi:MAG TPA: gliding motility-associated C-terminal domain-containing protein, partial [Segetibacter sp.]
TSFLQPVATPPTDTTFTLNVVSNKGCGVSFDEVRLKVYKTVTIPNAFSPNGDGINDVWQISQLNFYPNARLLVFNRYGTQVYSSKGTYQPWKGTYNGTRLPSGTYYYTLDLGIRSLRYSGWVLLLQ